jgi:uncharacterized membrane protein
MVATLSRWLRHLATGPWTRRRAFPASALAAIENAVRDCESRHAGEIRFAIDIALSPGDLWRGVTPRAAALGAFSQLRVWDTAHNNGVLIYVLLAERVVEIVADRGVGRGKVAAAEWEQCCRVMEAHFAQGRFVEGARAGIEAVADVLRRHPPLDPDVGDELPNEPAIL